MSGIVYQIGLNSIYASGAILVFLLLSRLFWEKTSPRLRYICWLFVVAGLLIPFRPALFNLRISGEALEVAETEQPQSNTYLYNGEYYYKGMGVPTAEQVGKTSFTQPEAAESLNLIDGEADSFDITRVFAKVKDFAVTNVLFIIWGAGVIVFISVCAVRHIKFLRVIKRWSRPAELQLKDFPYPINPKAQVLICPVVTSPVTVGIFRPAIILPDETADNDKLNLILLHESAHIRHGDLLTKALTLAAMSLHWFNPLVYVMNRAMIIEAELSGDLEVLKVTGEGSRFNYGEMILDTAKKVKHKQKTALYCAMSGGGKQLKKRLTAIVGNSAKRRLYAGFAFMLALCFVITGSFVGCDTVKQKKIAPIPDVPVDLTPTDELVIYIPNIDYIPIKENLEKAAEMYKEKYPDVNLIIEYLGETPTLEELTGGFDWYNTPYRQRLNTELMVGTGPDIIICNEFYFDDIFKTMDTGVFLNTDSIIENDESFDIGEYNEIAFNAGAYKGGRYMIPVSYSTQILVTGEKYLDECGFDLSKASDAVSLINEMNKCMPKLMEDPGFVRAFYAPINNFAFKYMGVRPIDYETGTVLPEEEKFREYCEALKPYWHVDASDKTAYNDSGSSSLFEMGGGIRGYCEAIVRVIEKGEIPVAAPLRDINGEIRAQCADALAIRAGSPNQLNAYNFIKIMLSEEIQNNMNAPVNKKSFDYQIEKVSREWRLDSQYTDLIKNVYAEIKYCDGINHAEQKEMLFFKEMMTPYFNDEKSLDDCLAEYKNKLTIYFEE